MGESSERFGLRSWSDVASLGALILLGFGVIAWGLKLEARIDENAREIAELKQEVSNGILPRAEERIRSLEQRLERHEDEDP